MKKFRTRFAPSPTGFLHIGSLRTVLFAFLAAKSNDGDLILRIEDTDQKRQVEGAVESLTEILDWIGIHFDEGPGAIEGADSDIGSHGPYTQSQRRDIYDKHKEELLKNDKAYRCFCTPERLTEMREDQQAKKLPPRYDRKCRDLTEEEIDKRIEAGESYVIRQKMPESGEVKVLDELRGEILFKAEEIDDQVLIKSDGMPTYQFAVVVDDHLMEISHVIRGEEWIPSFPKNILLYQAFDWEPPKFVHMPLTLNKEGGKLSKRQGDVAVEDYKAKGYLKEALINFSALLGWSPYGKETEAEKLNEKNLEILSMEDLIKKFSYKEMGISPAVFDVEKLDFINGYWIRQKPLEELVGLCRPYLAENLETSSNNSKKSDEFITSVVRVEQERLKKLSEIGELTKFLFSDNIDIDLELIPWKKITLEESIENLKKISVLLDKIPEENWTDDSIEEGIISYLKSNELKIGEYLWPMRVALSGKKASPGPFEIAQVLGKKETLERISHAVNEAK